jgi:hypothetical protein
MLGQKINHKTKMTRKEKKKKMTKILVQDHSRVRVTVKEVSTIKALLNRKPSKPEITRKENWQIIIKRKQTRRGNERQKKEADLQDLQNVPTPLLSKAHLYQHQPLVRQQLHPLEPRLLLCLAHLHRRQPLGRQQRKRLPQRDAGRLEGCVFTILEGQTGGGSQELASCLKSEITNMLEDY